LDQASVKSLLTLFLGLALAVPAAAAPGLWVVRDADTEISIFGTMHALPGNSSGLPAVNSGGLPPGAPDLPPPVTKRLAAADTLVLETVLPDDRMALGPLLSQLGLRPGQKPLMQRVSKAAAAKLIAATAQTGLPLAALDRMATWLAALTISQTTLSALGISSDNGVETRLTTLARATSKPIIGLETPEQQLRFFDNLPEADQILMLEATLDDVAAAKGEIDKLVALWRAGDVDTIARDFARDANASPLLAKVLVTDRNTRWADWIAGVMKRPGKVFVAVGAGHLGGAQGLLAQLRARGLVVEKVE
jgi:hypothetical protein